MGWRVRRSVKIFPGLRMNVGSRGVSSFSFGGRGVTVNIGKRGTKTTYSLPGTGISYQTKTQPLSKVSQSNTSRRPMGAYVVVGIVAMVGYFALRPAAAPTLPQASNFLAAPATGSKLTEVRPTPIIARAAAAQRIATQPSDFATQRQTWRDATTTTGANVRSAPSLSAAVVRVLDAGAALRIIGTENGWHRVLGRDGEPLGWVHGSIVR